MKEQDIDKCTEVYIKAFSKDREVADYYRKLTPIYFERYITSEYCLAYVLAEANTIIGMITAIIIPGICDDSIHIDVVAITPEYQNKGYGTQMLNEFIKCTGGKLYSLITKRNCDGYKLYKKAGFDDERDIAYMNMIPGLTDELMRMIENLEEN